MRSKLHGHVSQKKFCKWRGRCDADMAVHHLGMSRFLASADPIEILVVGSCHIDKSIESLPGSEKFDTASCLVRYPDGVTTMVDVCRKSSYGYDQRAEVLGNKGMIATDNVYPNTAKIYREDYTGNADMPFDFFLSRCNEAYVTETIAFCDALVNDKHVPYTGTNGLVALVMSIAADKSADENRWVKFSEIVEQVYCKGPTSCEIADNVFPEGFRPVAKAEDLLTPAVADATDSENSDSGKKFLSFF